MVDYWVFRADLSAGFVLFVREPLEDWWILGTLGRFLSANYGLLGAAQ